MSLSDPALTVALALAAGIIAQSAARHLRVPGIVLLLATGVLLGPDVAGVIRPDTLGESLHMLVGLAVAVILFEGGLSLNVDRLRHEARTIRRLITVGVLITAVGATVAARVLLGWEWSVAVLFGTLVTVTGPTVIQPLLRRIRVNRSLRTILEAEAVLIDPVGAILAVVALEVVLTTSPSAAAAGLLGLPGRLGVGAVTGLAGGFTIGTLLKAEHLVPEGLENVFTLALVLALFELADAVIAESGIMAVAVAGIVVGNMETRLARDLREFKEQLTVLLVGLLFVLLAADVHVARVAALGWPAVATVAALMLLIRPLDVAASTWGSALDLRERAFLSWLAPRGIVAAAVASLFAERMDAYGMAGGEALMEMVFLVIAATVVVQGATSGFVARLLGVRQPEMHGFLLVGANAVGRALARVLRDEGTDVVLVDTNASEARAAEEEGFRVVYGNANEERTLLQADVEARRGFVAITPNEGVNLLLARKAKEEYRVPSAYVGLVHRRLGVQAENVREVGALVLFGDAVDISQWAHLFLQDAVAVEAWRYEGAAGASPPEMFGDVPLLPLVLVRGETPGPMHDQVRVRPGDRVHFAYGRDVADGVRDRLHAGDWVPADGPAASREAAGGRVSRPGTPQPPGAPIG